MHIDETLVRTRSHVLEEFVYVLLQVLLVKHDLKHNVPIHSLRHNALLELKVYPSW